MTMQSLRNTLSKQVSEYTEEDAARVLAHPVFGKVNKVVRTAKPEVLSGTFSDESDEEVDTAPLSDHTDDYPEDVTFSDELDSDQKDK